MSKPDATWLFQGCDPLSAIAKPKFPKGQHSLLLPRLSCSRLETLLFQLPQRPGLLADLREPRR